MIADLDLPVAETVAAPAASTPAAAPGTVYASAASVATAAHATAVALTKNGAPFVDPVEAALDRVEALIAAREAAFTQLSGTREGILAEIEEARKLAEDEARRAADHFVEREAIARTRLQTELDAAKARLQAELEEARRAAEAEARRAAERYVEQESVLRARLRDLEDGMQRVKPGWKAPAAPIPTGAKPVVKRAAARHAVAKRTAAAALTRAMTPAGASTSLSPLREVVLRTLRRAPRGLTMATLARMLREQVGDESAPFGRVETLVRRMGRGGLLQSRGEGRDRIWSLPTPASKRLGKRAKR